MGVLSGNPQQEPMHYGEVFGVWSYLVGAQGMLAGYQTLINHTGDKDLRKFLEDTIQNVIKPEIEQTQALLKNNGVALPPAPPERSGASLENIPAGARFTDPEIAASVSKDIAAGLVACSQMMGQSIREDIALMFGQFHMKKAQYGATLLRINKEKGWLIPPPLQVQAGEPVHS
ncbi:hypothetical protein AM501_12875 [Aneurinibacillus migulanus]|uniref:DUF3231 family protein n=1 Tax=Aneurinibacillus migulanus TaxID=47500 RepID=UPI0005BD757B|nr:DUF3231 family protein [Aneurinibacillus migulanus]KIV50272.1 membrane protein [Aneurinibacillus migulanus]KPD07900.1 hypothetical protein AM501_12875 [Aneurinibacillus migulanus]